MHTVQSVKICNPLCHASGLLYTGLCHNRWKATTKNQVELDGMENLLSVDYIIPSESKINFTFAIELLSTRSQLPCDISDIIAFPDL